MGDTIVLILGIVVPIMFLYGMGIVVLKIVTKCSVQEAREIIADFIKSQFNENNTIEYELKNDENYIREVNTVCEDILGEKRYKDLCLLTKNSITVEFRESSGYPSVYITVNPIDENDRIRMQNILVDTTRLFIENYNITDLEVIAEWGENRKKSFQC